jgi:hypothetical protein
MTVSRLTKELEIAQERLKQMVIARNKIGEYMTAHAAVLSLERQLAAERMEEYVDPLDFPVTWDVGAPMPHLIANGSHTFLGFYLRDNYLEGERIESIALVEFYRCISVKLGSPNDEIFHGHPLYGKGLDFYTAQIVRNSKWINELEAINKVHSQYNKELWRSLNHYVLWFHDETFECIAKSFRVEIFQTNMDEVILDATKRALI